MRVSEGQGPVDLDAEQSIDKASDRKLRLFAVACCRRLAARISGDWCHDSVAAAERFADGLATEAERSAAMKAAQRAAQVRATVAFPTASKWVRRAASAVYYAADREARAAVWNTSHFAVESLILWAEGRSNLNPASVGADERKAHYGLLRDVFGNVARPVAFDPRWRTSDAFGLAQAIYDERAFERLPVLGDALMDAGCEDEAVLAHCRSSGPHVRGCWVVDLILSKDR
jgi:hypothetical protein